MEAIKKPAETQELIQHLDHVDYPTTGKQLMEACNRMSDVTTEQKNWVKNHVSENRTYGTKDELRKALDI